MHQEGDEAQDLRPKWTEGRSGPTSQRWTRSRRLRRWRHARRGHVPLAGRLRGKELGNDDHIMKLLSTCVCNVTLDFLLRISHLQVFLFYLMSKSVELYVESYLSIFFFNSRTSTHHQGSSWEQPWGSSGARWWYSSGNTKITRSFSTSARRRWRPFLWPSCEWSLHCCKCNHPSVFFSQIFFSWRMSCVTLPIKLCVDCIQDVAK